MTGLVIQCHLVNPTMMGQGDAAYLNKMIRLKPLNVEYEWATSFLGQSTELRSYVGPVYEGDITFTTRHTPSASGNGCKCLIYKCLQYGNRSLAAPASPARSMGKRPARYGQVPVASSIFKQSLSVNNTGMQHALFYT